MALRIQGLLEIEVDPLVETGDELDTIEEIAVGHVLETAVSRRCVLGEARVSLRVSPDYRVPASGEPDDFEGRASRLPLIGDDDLALILPHGGLPCDEYFPQPKAHPHHQGGHPTWQHRHPVGTGAHASSHEVLPTLQEEEDHGGGSARHGEDLLPCSLCGHRG